MLISPAIPAVLLTGCGNLLFVKTMRHSITVFLIAYTLSLLVPGTNCQAQCSATRLSTKEAESLLRVTPGALEAKRLDGKLSIVLWSPGASYRTDEFYFYQLLSSKSLPTTPLDNGMIGYFGVNKVTGQVVEMNSDKPSVEGTELSRVQQAVRAKHCIGSDLVARHQDVSLER